MYVSRAKPYLVPTSVTFKKYIIWLRIQYHVGWQTIIETFLPYVWLTLVIVMGIEPA